MAACLGGVKVSRREKVTDDGKLAGGDKARDNLRALLRAKQFVIDRSPSFHEHAPPRLLRHR
jgi:hypothetical protein